MYNSSLLYSLKNTKIVKHNNYEIVKNGGCAEVISAYTRKLLIIIHGWEFSINNRLMMWL